MPALAFVHNRVRDEITFHLHDHLEAHREQGTSVAEQFFPIATDTVFGPDVAFISAEQIPRITQMTPPFSPALVVEVASPSNRLGWLAHKTKLYLEAGTKRVWIADTEMREIRIYSASAPPRLLSGADRLEDPLLPGFSVTVDELFDV